jgi:hypothetical protein
MASKADLRIHLVTDGDIVLDQLHAFATNINSPAMIEQLTLNANANRVVANYPSGFNRIGPPVGMLIIPAAGNTRSIKMVAAAALVDGIDIGKTNPSLLSLDLTLGVPGGIYFEFNPPAPVDTPVPGIMTIIWF